MSRKIPVALLQFGQPQDGPGLSVASSCKASERHTIEYVPAVQSFFVKYSPPGNDPVRMGLIPLDRVSHWIPENWESFWAVLTPQAAKKG